LRLKKDFSNIEKNVAASFKVRLPSF